MNIFTRFKYSLVGYKGYINLMQEKLSKAFLHVLILTFITSTFLGVAFIFLYNETETEIIEGLSLQENEFTYENGNLDYKNGTLKYDVGEVLVLIDTSKSIDDYEQLRSVIVHKDSAIALTSNGIIFRTMSNEMILKYSDIFVEGFELNNDSLIQIVDDYGYLKYIFILWIIVIAFLYKMYYALIISLIGTLVNFMNKTNLAYRDIFKASAYSLTLVTLLELFIPIGSFTVLISGMYVVFALNRIRKLQNEKNEIQ